jgi:hypothetical protein
MAEPNTSEDARLSERLARISAALKAPANGHARTGHGITREVLRALAGGIVPFVRDAIAEATAPLVARNAVCEQRIAELEQQLAECLKDGGTWRAEKLFRPGEVVTYRGVPWVCNEANTNERPGRSKTWRLMAKSQGHRWGMTPDPD